LVDLPAASFAIFLFAFTGVGGFREDLRAWGLAFSPGLVPFFEAFVFVRAVVFARVITR
jgi:hypothetical protein